MKTTTKTKEELPRGQRVRRPSHPGVLLRDLILPAAGVSHSQVAKRMGVPTRVVNSILDEQRGINVDTALRLGKALGADPRFWLNMQQAVDMWDAMQPEGSAGTHGLNPW